MNSLSAKFRDSAKELGNIKNLSICAMLLALRVTLGYFSNFTLTITPDAKIGFNFLPVAMVGILFGPVCGIIVGGLGDALSFLLAPMGGYFFGWTLNGMLVGMLYGIFLYKNNCKLPALIVCEVLIALLVEIPLGSLWLYIQYNKGFWVTAGLRAVKSLIAIPIETALTFFFAKVLKKLPK